MNDEYEQLPAKIFTLTYDQHRVNKISQFLTYNKIKFNKKARKSNLLHRLAALEKIYQTKEEQEAISRWLRTGRNAIELDSVIGEKRRSINIKRDCSVCMESLTGCQFPQKKLAITCIHKPSICLACLQQSLSEQIEDRPWDQIACPECPERLTFEVVREFATKDAFERYDKKSLLAAFSDMPNFTMCLGPNCGSGQIHGGGNDQPIMTCTTCKFKTCFTHKMPWHEGLTCDQYDAGQAERVRQEAASAKVLAKTTKTCPNPKCGLHLDKYTGCDHVLCRQCGHEFCWVCLAPFAKIRNGGNSFHSVDCKYHTDRLNGIVEWRRRTRSTGDPKLALYY